MEKKIYEISGIAQGSILTRIKAIDGGILKEAVTMQELSFYNNISDEKGEPNEVQIDRKRIDNAYFTERGDILVGLSSGKAMVVEKNDEGKLVLSNFFRIRINDLNEVDPYYLCWLLNENKDIKRATTSLTQGTARVSILPLAFVKELEVKLLPIEEQRKIGQIYDLERRRIRLRRRKEELSQMVHNQLLMETYRK
jgi:restriction endonuclease S subunit